MRIEGEWLLCTDGITRPLVRVLVPDVNGRTIGEPFLVDTGADRTVFTAAFLQVLQMPVAVMPGLQLAGVGGNTAFVEFDTFLEFVRSDGGYARVRGRFCGFTAPTAFEMNVLGRDVLNNFTIISNWRAKELLLLAPPTYYQIV